MTTRFAFIAVSFLGLAVLGCTDESPLKGLRSSASATAAHADAKPVLTLLAWDNSFTTNTIEEFEARSGASLVVDSFDTADEMIERLKTASGKYDVVLIDDANFHSLKEARLVRALDHGKLTNFRHIDPRFRDLDFDPANRYSVPYNWGTTLIAYRSDKIFDPEQSWALLFDERFSGKASLLPEKTDCITSVLFNLGCDPAISNLAQVRTAEEHLMQQLSTKCLRFNDIEEARQGLKSGDQWIAMMYSSDAAELANESKPDGNIAAFIPREGALLWLDSFVISRDSQNPDLAHAFIDYMLEPEVAARVSNARCFATANAAALPLLRQDLKDDEIVYPPEETLNRCRFLSSQTGEVLELMNTTWWEIQGREEVRDTGSSISTGF